MGTVTMQLQIKRIDGIRIVRTLYSGEYLEVECEMGESDMCNAFFGQFLKNITDAQLVDWMKKYDLGHLIKD